MSDVLALVWGLATTLGGLAALFFCLGIEFARWQHRRDARRMAWAKAVVGMKNPPHPPR